jgi:hypothetical protein
MRDNNNQLASLINGFVVLALVISLLQEFIPITNDPLMPTQTSETAYQHPNNINDKNKMSYETYKGE